jgi:hypothetical protein
MLLKGGVNSGSHALLTPLLGGGWLFFFFVVQQFELWTGTIIILLAQVFQDVVGNISFGLDYCFAGAGNCSALCCPRVHIVP